MQISQQDFTQSFNNVYAVAGPEIQITDLTKDKEKQPNKTLADRWSNFKTGLKEELSLLAQAYKDNDSFKGLKSVIPLLIIPAFILLTSTPSLAGDGMIIESVHWIKVFVVKHWIISLIVGWVAFLIIRFFFENHIILTIKKLKLKKLERKYPVIKKAGGGDAVIEVIASKRHVYFCTNIPDWPELNGYRETYGSGEIPNDWIVTAAQYILKGYDFEIHEAYEFYYTIDPYISKTVNRTKRIVLKSNVEVLDESVKELIANQDNSVFKKLSNMETKNILTVCNSNYNRSQAMEMVLENLIDKKGLGKSVTVSSGAVKVEAEHGWGGINENLQEAFKTQFSESPKKIESKSVTNEQVIQANIIIVATDKIKEKMKERFGKLLDGKTVLVFEDLTAGIKTKELENAPNRDATKLFKTRQVIEHVWPQIISELSNTKTTSYDNDFKTVYQQAKQEKITDRSQLKISDLLDSEGQPVGKEKGLTVVLRPTLSLLDEMTNIQKDLYESMPDSLKEKIILLKPSDFHATLGATFFGKSKENITQEDIEKLKQVLQKGIKKSFSLTVKTVGAFKRQVLILEIHPKRGEDVIVLEEFSAHVALEFPDFIEFDPVLYHIALGYVNVPLQETEQKALYEIIDSKRSSFSEMEFTFKGVNIEVFNNTKNVYDYELLEQIEVMPVLTQKKYQQENVFQLIGQAI